MLRQPEHIGKIRNLSVGTVIIAAHIKVDRVFSLILHFPDVSDGRVVMISHATDHVDITLVSLFEKASKALSQVGLISMQGLQYAHVNLRRRLGSPTPRKDADRIDGDQQI